MHSITIAVGSTGGSCSGPRRGYACRCFSCSKGRGTIWLVSALPGRTGTCCKTGILTGWGMDGLLTLALPICPAQSSCPEVTLPVGMCGCLSEATAVEQNKDTCCLLHTEMLRKLLAAEGRGSSAGEGSWEPRVCCRPLPAGSPQGSPHPSRLGFLFSPMKWGQSASSSTHIQREGPCELSAWLAYGKSSPGCFR